MDTAEVQLKMSKLFPFGGKSPNIHKSVFVAPGAKIIGDVQIGKNSGVWFNAVIRGDVNFIKIGEMTNIQDCAVLHVTGNDFPLLIGNMVTIGHNACIHACILENKTLIGIGSVVLDGAIVKEKSLVAAGAVVRPGFIVPPGTLAAGVPAKIVRDLSQDELEYFEISAKHYSTYAEETRVSIDC